MVLKYICHNWGLQGMGVEGGSGRPMREDKQMSDSNWSPRPNHHLLYTVQVVHPAPTGVYSTVQFFQGSWLAGLKLCSRQCGSLCCFNQSLNFYLYSSKPFVQSEKKNETNWAPRASKHAWLQLRSPLLTVARVGFAFLTSFLFLPSISASLFLVLLLPISLCLSLCSWCFWGHLPRCFAGVTDLAPFALQDGGDGEGGCECGIHLLTHTHHHTFPASTWLDLGWSLVFSKISNFFWNFFILNGLWFDFLWFICLLF